MTEVAFKYILRGTAGSAAGIICMAVSFFGSLAPASGAEVSKTQRVVSGGGVESLGETVIVEGMFGDPLDGTAQGVTVAMLSGNAGQLVEPKVLRAKSSDPAIPETSFCRLVATFQNDDGSFTDVLSDWVVLEGPFVSVSSDGLALADAVYTNTSAVLAGISGGLTGRVNVTVLDTLKDNYGLYAADGVADSWQVSLFGVGNTSGQGGADADFDGQDNYSEFMAGTSPLNGQDVFGIKSMRRNASGQVELVLSPAFSNRLYHVERCTDLNNPSWVQLASLAGPAQLTQLVMADSSSTNQVAFYRASIDYVW